MSCSKADQIVSFNPNVLIEVWVDFTETIILWYPLYFLKDYRYGSDPPKYHDIPEDLQERCDMVKFFDARVENTKKLIASNPNSIAAETRKTMNDLLDYYDWIDSTEDIRDIQSVKNWLGGDDKVLLAMVNMMWDYAQAEKELQDV
jgi:hypothetical protein